MLVCVHNQRSDSSVIIIGNVFICSLCDPPMAGSSIHSPVLFYVCLFVELPDKRHPVKFEFQINVLLKYGLHYLAYIYCKKLLFI